MHEYERRLKLALGTLQIGKGDVIDVQVAHDNSKSRRCGIYRNNECDCDPDISVKKSSGEWFDVDRNGIMTKRLRS